MEFREKCPPVTKLSSESCAECLELLVASICDPTFRIEILIFCEVQEKNPEVLGTLALGWARAGPGFTAVVAIVAAACALGLLPAGLVPWGAQRLTRRSELDSQRERDGLQRERGARGRSAACAGTGEATRRVAPRC